MLLFARVTRVVGLRLVSACLCLTGVMCFGHVFASDRLAADVVVNTTSGPVTGAQLPQCLAWLGLPYAAAPVAGRRWMPPVPPPAWTRPRACIMAGPLCPQLAPSAADASRPQSEDCLQVHIWSGATTATEGLPVLVWLHGGGFHKGSASSAATDGRYLAARGCVVVAVSYRLGAFGFMAHPELSAEQDGHSGNLGLLDQIAALRWVQANISAFGGDPNRVTIGGQSAGAVSVASLLASPLTPGLFHAAWSASGGAPARLRWRAQLRDGMPSMESDGQGFFQRLGVDNLRAARQADVRSVLRAWSTGSTQAGGGTLAHLSVDGNVLVEPPGISFAAGRQQALPLLIGATADEGSIFIAANNITGMASYRAAVQAQWGRLAPWLLALYPAADDAAAVQAYARLIGDSFLRVTRTLTRDHHTRGGTVFSYRFQQAPRWAGALGASHGADLVSWFGTHDLLTNVVPTAAERLLSQQMQAYLVHFLRTHDPNHPGAVSWTPWTTGSQRHVLFSDDLRAAIEPRQVALAELDALLLDPLSATDFTVRIGTGPLAARWRLNGGPWQASGQSVRVAMGDHFLECEAVAGWIAPAPQLVSLAGTQQVQSIDYLKEHGRWAAGPSATSVPWPDDRLENLLATEAGELVAIGGFTRIDQVVARRIARWDGNRWWPLAAGLNRDAEAITQWRAGLYAGGFFTDPADFLARWDGAAWHGVGGGANAPVRALGQWNDSLIVAGQFSQLGTTEVGYIAAWNGRRWDDMAGGADGFVFASAGFANDLIVTGDFKHIGGVAAEHIARWDGRRWQPLGAGLNAPAYALCEHAGRLYATGDFTAAGGQAAAHIACWNGRSWQALGRGLHEGSQPYGRALASWRGLLVVGGHFRSAGAWRCQCIAAWDGVQFLPFGAGLNNWVEGLAVSDGSVVAAGWFNHASQAGALGYGRWQADPNLWQRRRRIHLRVDPANTNWQVQGSRHAIPVGGDNSGMIQLPASEDALLVPAGSSAAAGNA